MRELNATDTCKEGQSIICSCPRTYVGMPENVENCPIGGIVDYRSSRQVRITSKATNGLITRNGCEIRRRDLDKMGLELIFIVLFTDQGSIFSNGCRDIIGGITTRIAWTFIS